MSGSDVDVQGTAARAPWNLSLDDWKAAAGRAWTRRGEDDLTGKASAVAFSAVLSLPTLLIAVVSLYGLVASPESIDRLLDDIPEVVPTSIVDVLSGQMKDIQDQGSGALSFGLFVGLAGAVWSVSGGIGRLRQTINEVYHEQDTRPWYTKRLATIAAAIAVIVFLTISVGLIAGLGSILDAVGVQGTLRSVLFVLRWPLLAVLMIGLIAALLRFGPHRRPARWEWIIVGTLLAAAGWLVASVGFSVYTANFASYNKTYGSLASAVILLMWLYVTAFLMLLAGEFNAELEHQTIVDTTVGPDRPFGRRGAYVADHHPSLPDPTLPDRA